MAYIQIDRESIIHKIVEEYNSTILLHDNDMIAKLDTAKNYYQTQCNLIIERFKKKKHELEINYKFTLKYIESLYDSYEVTLSQLQAYNNVLLEKRLYSFPRFDNFSLNTNIITPIKEDYKQWSIHLGFDPTMIDNNRYISNYDYTAPTTNTYTYIVTISQLNKYLYVNNSLYNGIAGYIDMHNNIFIIKKLVCKGSVRYIYVFIDISTKKIIYKSYSSADIYFTGCNKQLISLIRASEYKLYITVYNIDDITNIKFTKYEVCIAERLSPCLNSDLSLFAEFYGDNRGLYLATNAKLIFIDSLHNLINNIVNQCRYIKLNLDSEKNMLQVLNINYETGKILIRIFSAHYSDGGDYDLIFKLGMCDMYNLIY